MNKVLILNHKEKKCGVYQSGKRIYDLVADSSKVGYFYREASTLAEFLTIKNSIKPDYIFYNWHRGTMQWLTENIVADDTKTKHYFYYHENFMRRNYDKYLFFGAYDINCNLVPEDKRILMPRPLLVYDGDYPVNKVPTIGSFGFATWQKGLHNLVTLVNKTFTEAVINLHIPTTPLGDPTGRQSLAVIKECMKRNVSRPRIKLNISQTFMDEQEVLKFLAKNDLNAFLYEENGDGLSGSLDYALSVRRPIAIKSCQMFRHFMKDEIVIEKHSLKEILANGTKPLEEFYDKWSTDNFKKKMDEVFSV